MIRAGLAIAGLLLLLAACGPKLPSGVDKAALDNAIGDGLGDPGLCVLVAGDDGKPSYRYGGHMTCGRALADCAGGSRSADAALALAVAGQAQTISCPSNGDAARITAWALGRTPKRGLPYVAAMESARALPGVEIKRRLDGVFSRSDL